MNNKIYNDKFNSLTMYVGELRKFAVHTYLEVEKIKSKLEKLTEESENDNGIISKSDLKEIIEDLKQNNNKELEKIIKHDQDMEKFKFNIDDF